jgi:hypothetical protein
MADMAEPMTAKSNDTSTEGDQLLTVRNLPGAVLAELTSMPAQLCISELKTMIEKKTLVPPALQKLVDLASAHVYSEGEMYDTLKYPEVVMIHDETALFTWHRDLHSDFKMLEIEGSHIKCEGLRSDYCNVLTLEPIRQGVHYFEFVMHHIGDEQWCGLMKDPQQAGCRVGGRSLTAWSYYCGRMGSYSNSIQDDRPPCEGALHAEGRAVALFKKLKPNGDVIGMLADLDAGAVAFDLNGELQGACAVPKQIPLWVFTHVDTTRDHVELRKLSLQDAPPTNLAALKGALLDISAGEALRY